MSSVFEKKLESIIEKYKNDKVALFFRGFSPLQNKVIFSSEYAASTKSLPLIDNEDYLLLDNILVSSKDFILDLMYSNCLKIGVYEQLIPVRGSLKELYNDGRIIIIDNNLFGNLFPSPLSPCITKSLCSVFQDSLRVQDKNIEAATQFYADAINLRGEDYLVTPISYREEILYETIPFYERKVCQQTSFIEGATLAIPSPDLVYYKLSVLSEDPQPINFLVEEEDLVNSDLEVLASALSELHVPFGIKLVNAFESQSRYTDNEFLPLLKKYWGNEAEFRTLKFYKNPSRSHDMINISQGNIISQVISQCESALKDNEFRNVFITAPTGAGKSILFQLPALHLAENYDAVTIVVTPIIALMRDQVTALTNDHHVRCATFLNSSNSWEERTERIEKIRNGKISIVYLAPELLLSVGIENIIGNRKIGLFVIDEAHTVSSWGKDFRSDYWFLGDYLVKLRRYGHRFPVFCLTATAVFGGRDDVVNQTIEDLELEKPIIYLGNVRREEISFEINVLTKNEYEGSADVYKMDLLLGRMKKCISSKEKTLVFCPFTSQVNSILDSASEAGFIRGSVMKYHGSMMRDAKELSQDCFKSGRCLVMICTKAFSMGVDVKDISNVIHYAPTGNLADYVQEVGRAARIAGSKGTAITDYFHNDVKYMRMLHGMSEMTQYQLKEILRKLYEIYNHNGRRQNMLVSPESFSYLFDETKDIENKVKSALLMIAKDLHGAYGFPVVIVKPKPSYTKNYINVPVEIEEKFLTRYEKYATKMPTPLPKHRHGSRHNGDITITNTGSIYQVEMARLWEELFTDMTFQNFKYQFFQGTLFELADEEKLAPRSQLNIKYLGDFSDISNRFIQYIQYIEKIFFKYRKLGKNFTADEFRREIKENFGSEFTRLDFCDALLDYFVVEQRSVFSRTKINPVKCISKRRDSQGKNSFQVSQNSYSTLSSKLEQQLNNCFPTDDGHFITYFAFGERQPEEIGVASLLELLGLASYEIKGGEDLEIFVRLNDPQKIANIANGRYSNAIAQDIKRRHKYASEVMASFFMQKLEDGARWDIIESYFLGEDNLVREQLGLSEIDPGDIVYK